MGHFADLYLSSVISNISGNKRQSQSEACGSIGLDGELRLKAGEKYSAIKNQTLIWFFCVYEKSKWKLMHTQIKQALSSLTLVGDFCMPAATQPPVLFSVRRKTVHHHLVALVEQDKTPSSFPCLAQKQPWDLTLTGTIMNWIQLGPVYIPALEWMYVSCDHGLIMPNISNCLAKQALCFTDTMWRDCCFFNTTLQMWMCGPQPNQDSVS